MKTTCRNAIALYLCQGLGLAAIKELSKRTDINTIFDLKLTQLIELGLNTKVAHQVANISWSKVDSILKLCERDGIIPIHYSSHLYPESLKELCNAPLMLFCYGNTQLLMEPQIAIVGSRNATPVGLEIAAEFAYELNNNGITVTSGLALGIDGAAHKGCLANMGQTIAVLGTGVDIIYPKRHSLLYQQIKDKGLLVSEFLPGVSAQANNFPRRNRIISGLSMGTLIVEAEIKSGSLITAKYALEQNKEVFAIPGSIKNPMSKGCHYLIQQGAKLTENIDDILEEMSFLHKNSLYINKSEITNSTQWEDCPVLNNLGFEVTSIDTLIQRTRWPVSKVVTRLTDLELEDKVERVLDGYIKLPRG